MLVELLGCVTDTVVEPVVPAFQLRTSNDQLLFRSAVLAQAVATSGGWYLVADSRHDLRRSEVVRPRVEPLAVGPREQHVGEGLRAEGRES